MPGLNTLPSSPRPSHPQHNPLLPVTHFLSRLTCVPYCFHLVIGFDLRQITTSYHTRLLHASRAQYTSPEINDYWGADSFLFTYFQIPAVSGPSVNEREGRDRTGSGKSVLLFQTCLASYTICLLIWVIKARKLHPLLSVALWVADCPTTVRFDDLPVPDKGFTEKLQCSSPFCLTQCITYIKYGSHHPRQLWLPLQVNSNCPSSQLLLACPWGFNPVFKKTMPDICCLKK